jgi:Helix-turn-helix domain
MSDKAKGHVWELDLPHNEKWVLLAMADHADHNGRNIYPGHALTAYKTDYSENTVIRLVRKLRERGILVLADPARRPSPSNPYHIDWERCTFKPPFASLPWGGAHAEPRTDNLTALAPTKNHHSDPSCSDQEPPFGRARTTIQQSKNHHLDDQEPPFPRLQNALNRLTLREPLEPSRTPAGAPASARAREGDVDIIKYGNGNKKEGGKEGKKERERLDLSRYVPCIRCKNVMVDPNTPPILCDDCRRKQRGGGRDPIQMYPRLEKRGQDRP